MIPNRCIEVHTSSVDRPSVPPWFAEVVIQAQSTIKWLQSNYSGRLEIKKERIVE